jgi:hypothetical protein
MISLEHLEEDDSQEAAALRHIFDIPYAYAPKRPPRFRIEPFKANADT